MYQSKTTIVLLAMNRIDEKAPRITPLGLMQAHLAAAALIASGCGVDVVSITVQPLFEDDYTNEQQNGAVIVYTNNGCDFATFKKRLLALPAQSYWKIRGVDIDEGMLLCDCLYRIGNEPWP